TDVSDPDYATGRENRLRLEGMGLEVIEIDVLPEVVIDGQRADVPPLNLYLANGAAVVPVVDGPEGDAALAAVRGALPEREVIGVPGDVLAFGGGGIHCITQQVPR
ncbi:MAG TPA: agmatine deiminase family protein, partial [Acidimicrobiales bacterium]